MTPVQIQFALRAALSSLSGRRCPSASSLNHVAEQLGLVDRQYLLDRFEFQQQAAFDQNVETKRLFEDKTLVFDSDNALVDSGQLAEAQFAEEALLINAFDQARPLETMDLDGGADDGVAQLIGFLEQWMHERILQ